MQQLQLPPPRLMTVWRDPRGQVVATVSQGVTIVGGRPAAVYIAAIAGESQQRKTFACAKRAIDTWAVRNNLRLTASAA